MPDSNSLAKRIDAEFAAVEERIKKIQVEQVEGHAERQKRLEQLGKVFNQLHTIWKPRLEVLVKKFGDRVKVTPRVIPSTREATFEFQSKLARIRLRFSAATDRDIHNVILSYDLDISPVLIRFNPHDEVEFPLQAVDHEAAEQWFDDRIVEFVRTYLSLSENDAYLKDHFVEDPVVHLRFPKVVAGATLEWQGKQLYFVSEETRREFAKENKIAIE